MNTIKYLSYVIIGFGGCLVFLSIMGLNYESIINSIIATVAVIGLYIAIKELKAWKNKMTGQLYEEVLLWSYRIKSNIEELNKTKGDWTEVIKKQVIKTRDALKSENIQIAKFKAKALKQFKLEKGIENLISSTQEIERAVIVYTVLNPISEDDPGVKDDVKKSLEEIKEILSKGGFIVKIKEMIKEIEEGYEEFLNK